ncbi:lipid II flippase MurJ, partial [Klebsiella pneumoniae]
AEDEQSRGRLQQWGDRLQTRVLAVYGRSLDWALRHSLLMVISLLATQAMNALFVFGLQMAHVGLALAISLAACLNAGLLYWQLRRADIFQPLPGWGLFLLKLVVAVAVMVAVLLGLLLVMPAWAEGEMLVRLLR